MSGSGSESDDPHLHVDHRPRETSSDESMEDRGFDNSIHSDEGSDEAALERVPMSDDVPPEKPYQAVPAPLTQSLSAAVTSLRGWLRSDQAPPGGEAVNKYQLYFDSKAM